MSEIADRYRRLSDTFAATVAAVPDDGRTAQSPCEDWDACRVVGHVVETGEPPYPERYRVPPATADAVTAATGRVIAVGTTVTRALETTADERGRSHPGSGWTDLVLGPERPVRVVDGLLTGWHEPRASHLALLEAVAGRPLLERSYERALADRYRWHEFGDLHLVLP